MLLINNTHMVIYILYRDNLDDLRQTIRLLKTL